MSNILVTGGASGLGADIASALERDGHNVVRYDLKYGNNVCEPEKTSNGALAYLRDKGGLDVLINCAGINIIGWLDEFSSADWDNVVDTNAKGIFMMSRFCCPLLRHSRGTILNIVSNASHMPMTGSAAYNASKAAAHILTLQLARELTKKDGITVFGISPNKLSGTEMSKSIDRQVVETRGWSEEYAREYQLKGLLTGEETPPGRVAEFVAFLLSSKERHKYLSGCVIPYGA